MNSEPKTVPIRKTTGRSETPAIETKKAKPVAVMSVPRRFSGR